MSNNIKASISKYILKKLRHKELKYFLSIGIQQNAFFDVTARF